MEKAVKAEDLELGLVVALRHLPLTSPLSALIIHILAIFLHHVTIVISLFYFSCLPPTRLCLPTSSLGST